MPTYQLIQKTTVASDTATVSLTGIPATYTDLSLRMSVKQTGFAQDSELNLRFNSDSGTNYFVQFLRGVGSQSSAGHSGSAVNAINGKGSTAGSPTAGINKWAQSEIYICNYASTTQNKTIFWQAAAVYTGTPSPVCLTSASWANTSAITSMTFTDVLGNNIVAGSTFYLYGISNA